MKILLLDCETAPNLVTVWGLWNQDIAINQIMDSGYVLCWSAKWLNDDVVFFDSVFQNTPKKMLKNIHELLSEADAVIHYNGTKFDIPTLNKEFLVNGMEPPAPYKQIDLLNTAKAKFRFPSNKLDFIARELGLEGKTKHAGHQMWIDCMNNVPEAWAIMEEYNVQDVLLLEQVYQRLQPWIPNHPNHSVYKEVDGFVCPNCGSSRFHRRGFAYTNSYKYQRYQCRDCKTWFRDNHNIGKSKKGVVNVVS